MSRNIVFSTIFTLLSFSLMAQCIEGNCTNGVGSYLFSSGAKYVGSFKNGRIHGQGILYFSNGNKYVGDWVNQYREGKGVLTFKDGHSYSGDFKKSRFNGQGKMIFLNGDIYVGTWVDNLPNGKGKYNFKDGALYEGDFFNGAFHGVGEMSYLNGERYAGEWKNNKRHGQGTLYKKNGTSFAALWDNGNVVGSNNAPMNNQSPLTENKDKVKDCNREFCDNSQGVYVYPDGTKYTGYFVNGQPEGAGTIIYPNGNRYVGEWSKNAPNGEGIMYMSSGKVVGAQWKDGKMLKEIDNKQSDVQPEYVEADSDKEVKIWAVVVGVGRYTHMPVLKYTDDDAYQYYAFLKSPEGGAVPDNQIRLLIDEDATRNNILRAMRQIFLKADENDVVMLYFSGHGLDGSFIPVDFDGFNNKLRHDEVKQIFNETKAKHKICFADACYSGSLLAMKAPVDKTLQQYFKAFENTTGGIALLMSSKSEEFSLEDQGLRSGVFSHYLIRGLKGEADTNSNKLVTIQELFEYIYTNVRNYTGNFQSPQLSGSFDKNMPVANVR